MRTPDVVVAGAGPSGCASALGLAREGARVVVLDPGASRKGQLSGEWIHPAGVTALERLGIRFDDQPCSRNCGFIVHPPDGADPIVLEYGGAVALGMAHDTLTGLLRNAMADHAGITLLPGHRVLAATDDGVALTTHGCYRAGLVVGADGRGSAVRRALRPDEPGKARLGRTAGFILPLALLPTEGYGHVFLGAPGPVLAFRVDADHLRVTFDIPYPGPGPGDLLPYLVEHYLPRLPASLRPAIRHALTARLVQWASNTFRPRSFHGRRRAALVGDSVGHNHPLAAQGLSLALLDAQYLAESPNLSTYRQRSRSQSWASEHVAAVVERLFVRPDPVSEGIRDGLFADWRASTARAEKAMRLLGILDTHTWPLATMYARTATHFLAQSTPVTPGALARKTLDLAAWAWWLSRRHPPPAPSVDRCSRPPG